MAINNKILQAFSMPWQNYRPCAAGGTQSMSLGWEVFKTTLLEWEDTARLGDEVHEFLANSTTGDLCGCVGQPLYTCVGRKWIGVDGRLVADDALCFGDVVEVCCGKRALLDDRNFALPEGETGWLCQECYNAGAAIMPNKPNRLIALFPLISTKAGKKTVCVPKGGAPACVLAVHLPPSAWSFPIDNDWNDGAPTQNRDLFRDSKVQPAKVALHDTVRFVYGTEESDYVWNHAGRYQGGN